MSIPDPKTATLRQQAADFLTRGLFEEAVPVLRQVTELSPSARTRSWLIAALISSGHGEEAIDQAIQANQEFPDSWEAAAALGRAMAFDKQYDRAVQAFVSSASFRVGLDREPLRHVLLHNTEQLGYLKRKLNLYPELCTVRLNAQRKQNACQEAREEDRLELFPTNTDAWQHECLPLFIPREPRIRQPLNETVDFEAITKEFYDNGATFVTIDDLLSTEALEFLRHFCLGATVWRRPFEGGYIGAFPEDGFACILLFRIADALQQAMPEILKGSRLAQWWAFVYEQQLSGTDIHADESDISVNLWITETEANLEPNRGGLAMWNRSAPADWNFREYNGDSQKARSWLRDAGATETIIPHRANRAILFNGKLFHRSDGTNFAPGYENRRRNITFLFHKT